MIMIQTMTVPQSSLVPILKELVKAKQRSCQPRKNAQMTHLKQSFTPQPEVAKPVITPKVVPTKTLPIGKRQYSLLLNLPLVIPLKQ